MLAEFAVLDPTVTKKIGTMLKYFRDRVDSKKNVEAHSYLLLNEGQHSSPHHAWIMAALERHGLGRIGSTVNWCLPPSSARRAQRWPRSATYAFPCDFHVHV